MVPNRPPPDAGAAPKRLAEDAEAVAAGALFPKNQYAAVHKEEMTVERRARQTKVVELMQELEGISDVSRSTEEEE